MTTAPSRRGDPAERDEAVRDAFQESLNQGKVRLSRTWPGLLSTGFVGGIDVGIGVLALLVIEHETGSRLLGALGFAIGFLALTLGRSELFTENFLVPVASVVARDATLGDLLRLWAGTFAANLAGGWVIMGLVLLARPELGATAIEAAAFYPDLGLGWEAFALAVVGGAAITVMTWMERGSRELLGKIVAATAIGFLLAAAQLNHVIVVSLEMFAALHTGEAPFGYGDWAATAALATLGNLAGGLLLVTILRLIQVGRHDIEQEIRRPPQRRASADDLGRNGESPP